ncbi:MAG: YceI family protein [Dehalococcoidia bacterium]
MVRRFAMPGGLGVLALAALAAFGVWYFFFRDDAPAPVDLQSAVRSVASSTADAGSGVASTATPSASGTASAGAASGSTSLVGTWQVASGGQSFVGYRVQEQLANVGAATAVGRTSAVTGTLTFDGSAITDVTIEADLTKLQSDRSQRDNALRQQALETNRFPTATFTLTQPIELSGNPEAGDMVEATAVGDLMLHGVTKSISIPLQGQLVNGQIVVVGSLDIVFADYSIAQPRAASVLSVENHGLIELQLILSRG